MISGVLTLPEALNAWVKGRRVRDFHFAGQVVSPRFDPSNPSYSDEINISFIEALTSPQLHSKPDIFCKDVKGALENWEKETDLGNVQSFRILEQLLVISVEPAPAASLASAFCRAFNSSAFYGMDVALRRQLLPLAVTMVGSWCLPTDIDPLSTDDKRGVSELLEILGSLSPDIQDAFVCLCSMAISKPERVKSYFLEKLSAIIPQSEIVHLLDHPESGQRFEATLRPLVYQ